MDVDQRSRWLWKARKWAISAFLVVHVGATCLWVLPESPLRQAAFPYMRYYIMPLGMWQYWGMFAPDPVRDTVTLEADVLDAHGMRHSFAFPKLADYSILGRVPRFRHSKFGANLNIAENELSRQMAARHILRQLAIPADAYPVDVRLIYQIRTAPAPGGPPPDPMVPPYPYPFAAMHFDRPIGEAP
ncbi:MAG: hypothetical protein U0794_14475 [Isosphaeraceae bacterium]